MRIPGLVLGFAWLLLAFVVLSFSHASIITVSVLTGAFLVMAGTLDLLIAFSARRWMHLYLVTGVLGVAAGIVAFAYPSEAFRVLALLLSWYLLIKGGSDLVRSLAERRIVYRWWLALIRGVAEILIGLWALAYPGHSTTLLTLWVGLLALIKAATWFSVAFLAGTPPVRLEDAGRGGAAAPELGGLRSGAGRGSLVRQQAEHGLL